MSWRLTKSQKIRLEERERLQALSVRDLIEMGYRRTSNRHGLISRIDREDWREEMARKHSPWSFEEGMNWVKALSFTPGGAEDHYRRCYSRDCITVTPEKAMKIPNSNWDPVGFVSSSEKAI